MLRSTLLYSIDLPIPAGPALAPSPVSPFGEARLALAPVVVAARGSCSGKGEWRKQSGELALGRKGSVTKLGTGTGRNDGFRETGPHGEGRWAWFGEWEEGMWTWRCWVLRGGGGESV